LTCSTNTPNLPSFPTRRSSDLYQQSLAIGRQLGDSRLEAQALKGIGDVYREQARWTEAMAILDQSLDIARRVSDRIHEARALTRSEEHTSELQSRGHLVCRLLL